MNATGPWVFSSLYRRGGPTNTWRCAARSHERFSAGTAAWGGARLSPGKHDDREWVEIALEEGADVGLGALLVEAERLAEAYFRSRHPGAEVEDPAGPPDGP